MADRASSDLTGLSAIVNGALIVVTIAGFLTLAHQELTSDRPAPPAKTEDGGIGSQTVDVRLWEDPLRSSKIDTPKQVSELVDEVQQRKSWRDVSLMPVLVSGSPYSEDRENRIRNRYAVVSALGRSGYAPKDEEHVGSVILPWPTTQGLRAWARHATTLEFAPNWDPTETYCGAEPRRCVTTLTIRYEWYRPRVFYPGAQEPVRKTLTCWRASRQGLQAGTWSEPYYADTHAACPLVASAAAQVWVRESRQAGTALP